MRKTKILLIEDETIVARDIKNMLIGLGYEVSEVLATGKEAVAMTEKLSPDLVLMDVMLQGEVDGIEAANRIYKNFEIPVVYITAYADENTLERAKLTEPFGYIVKPFNERELQTSIEIALYKYQMETEHREKERWLSTVLKSIGDAVIATDKRGNVTFMNPLAEKLTGWRQKDALNVSLDRIFRIKNEKSNKILKLSLEEVIAGKNFTFPNHVFLVSKGGGKSPIDLRMVSLSNNRSKTAGVVLTFTDVSHREKTERELKLSWEKLQEALEATVQALAFTIETRDPYTAGHQRRVTKLACSIAEEMGLPQDRIEGLRMAGALHDIGKISVPAEILSKPGTISEVEYNIIKTHPQVGYEILKNIEFPWPIAQIVHQHHERMDGSGYPQALKGERILLEARILAVSDVVEAMATHRPYHPAQPIEMALDEISKNKATLYDCEVVEACIKVFKKKGFKFE
jgi:PAS domain S-box-containing protein/putative nucleotidyltransferase with HDIG domain